MIGFSRRRFVRSVGIAAAAPALGALPLPAAAQQTGAGGIEVETDVVFGRGGDGDLHLDVYRPAAAGAKRMAIVHLHGGGFRVGSKRGVESSSRAFAGLGYVSVASQYRLVDEALWPAQLEDAKAAIRWTRANADRLGIDPDHVAVAGYSAGGLLALMAAGTGDDPRFEGRGGNAGVSSKVAACVAFYPSTTASERLFADGGNDALIAAASPGTYVSPDFAPTIFLHGMEDVTIPYTDSLAFFTRLHEAGVAADLHLIQGAPHAYEIRNPDAALASAQMANLFLDRVVVNPIEYPPFGSGR